MRFWDRARLGGAALRTAWLILDRWEIGTRPRCGILGWRSAPSLRQVVRRAKAGRPVVLQEAVLLRIGLVIGIHRMLGVLYLGEAQDVRWLRARHRAGTFGGTRPIDVLIQGGQQGLATVYGYLAALCAGGGTAPAPGFG